MAKKQKFEASQELVKLIKDLIVKSNKFLSREAYQMVLEEVVEECESRLQAMKETDD